MQFTPTSATGPVQQELDCLISNFESYKLDTHKISYMYAFVELGVIDVRCKTPTVVPTLTIFYDVALLWVL